MEWLKNSSFKRPQKTAGLSEEQNTVQWPENDADLKAIFDKITDVFGPPDVDFRAGSQSFKVHKKVLEKYSPVIKAKLSEVWQTSGDVLQLDEEYVKPEVVEELLSWMYYTNADIKRDCSMENAYYLCIAAHYLLMTELLTFCCEKLGSDITPENFYDLFTFSKHLNLEDLRKKCECSVATKPKIFFLSQQVAKWTAEELKYLIEKLFEFDDSPQTRGMVFLSLAIWADASFDDRYREIETLLEFSSPQTLSSDGLFRFMKTELYSKLGELHRNQYYVRSYLPTGMSSTDKLYCVPQAMSKLVCLDLSTNQKWSPFLEKRSIFNPKQTLIASTPVLGLSWRKNIYFIGYVPFSMSKRRHIKVFSTVTGECITSEVMEPLTSSGQEMLAGAVLGDYIYITDSVQLFHPGKKVCRFNLKTQLELWQAEALVEMQTSRLKHQLVALGGLLYAIGGEVFELDQGPRPERYDPQTNRWEYITPSHYHHELPATVTHEGQIYVLSQTGFETYSPEIGRWIQLPVPNVCLRPSLVSIAGRLWLMSDSVCRKAPRLVFEFYVVKQEWTRLPDMPEGDYSDFAFVIRE